MQQADQALAIGVQEAEIEQINAVLAAPLASPALLRCIDRRRGDDEMDMRVEVEPARVRVQDRGASRPPECPATAGRSG